MKTKRRRPKRKATAIDPETRRITAALKRASDRAYELAKATGTPFWVMKDGKIVDLLAKWNRRRRSRK